MNNGPSRLPHTSIYAQGSAMLPLILAIADKDPRRAMRGDSHFRNG